MKLDAPATIKRLRNRYRLVVMNDDTYEEVVTFKLSRRTVYVGLSLIFVLLVGLTTALLVLTPLKFYIPGYGSEQSRTQLQELRLKTDSLEQAVRYRDRYLENIRSILAGGNGAMARDTASLAVPKVETSKD